MCMLMSVTKVNLVEAASSELAEIPISFLEPLAYKNLKQRKDSIAFCDIAKMRKSNRAPVYVNKEPKGSRWFTMEGDRAVFGK